MFVDVNAYDFSWFKFTCHQERQMATVASDVKNVHSMDPLLFEQAKPIIGKFVLVAISHKGLKPQVVASHKNILPRYNNIM